MTCKGKTQTHANKVGFVFWWDPSSGEGQIHCPADNKTYYVHWSAIKNQEKPYNLTKRHPVKFSLYENSFMSQVDSISELKFDYSVDSEKRLQQLLNDCWNNGDTYCFDLAEIYYGQAS